MAPEWRETERAVHCQIVDVFALQVVTGYTRDPQGNLPLAAHPFVAAGRSWSLAKAAQLVRHDAKPERWVVLQRNNRAWGLIWAGGGTPSLPAGTAGDRAIASTELCRRSGDAASGAAAGPQSASGVNAPREGTPSRLLCRRSAAPTPAMATAVSWRLCGDLRGGIIRASRKSDRSWGCQSDLGPDNGSQSTGRSRTVIIRGALMNVIRTVSIAIKVIIPAKKDPHSGKRLMEQ